MCSHSWRTGRGYEGNSRRLMILEKVGLAELECGWPLNGVMKTHMKVRRWVHVQKRQASGDFEAETNMVFFQASRRIAIGIVGLGNISDSSLSGLSWLRVGRVLSASRGLIG